MDKRLFTINEAAIYTALSVDYLYHLVENRLIPFVRWGKRKGLRFDKADLDKEIDKRKVKTIKETKADGTLQARRDILASVHP